jgi:uncharacterized protein involved in cysteine biosynthesis
MSETRPGGAERVGFVAAAGAPFGGVAAIAGRASLWPLASAPTLLLGLTVAGLGAGATRLYSALGARADGLAQGGWLARHERLAGVGLWATRALLALALIVAILAVAGLIVPALSAPFMDKIAQRVDARRLEEPPLVQGALRSVRVALFGALLFGVLQGLFAVLSLVLSPLSWLFAGLAWVVSALALAYDALDWPLARRGLGVRARLDWMGRHRSLVVGLGFGVWVISLVPGLGIVLLAGVVAGGVSLINRVEAVEGPIDPARR